jgi:pimeloyl-ACP methyl ester carboxylesterase
VAPIRANKKVIELNPTDRQFIGIIYSKMRKIGFMHPQIHYQTWGTGPKILFAFHGYGESASAFAFWGEALDPDHTLIAIDLPFHGQTDWKKGLDFYPEQLFHTMEDIAAQLSFPHTAHSQLPAPDRWGLIGYSMGGRIALQLLQKYPDRFDRVILLAPDGLKVNFWYWLATTTTLGNRLFRRTMRRPGWLFLLLRLSHALRLVNPSVYKFAVHYIDDKPVRDQLYTRWTVMRKFKPDLTAIAAIIRNRQLPVYLVYGKYDRIIRWQSAEKFRNRGIAATSRLILLDTGHQLLRPQFLPSLLPLLTV